jgi:hypothetical protein
MERLLKLMNVPLYNYFVCVLVVVIAKVDFNKIGHKKAEEFCIVLLDYLILGF